MIDQPQFRTVLRGLDPDQVAAAIKELHTSLVVARRTAADRTVELTKAQQEQQELQAALDEARERLAEAERSNQASARGYGDLGTRIAGMLSLAEEEAELIRVEAGEEVQRQRDEAAAYAASVREESDTYATQTRLKAEREARRIGDAAQASADSVVAKAQEEAARLRAEAEAQAQEQLQGVEQARSELAAELAAEREQAMADLVADKERHESELEAAMARLAQLDEEITSRFREADALATHTVEEAQAKAAQILHDAAEDARSQRLRTEQELAAALAHRDEIYGHLEELRHVLEAVLDTHHHGVDAPVGRHAKQPVELDASAPREDDPAAADLPARDHLSAGDHVSAGESAAGSAPNGAAGATGTGGGVNGARNGVDRPDVRDDWSGSFDGEPWRHAEAEAGRR